MSANGSRGPMRLRVGDGRAALAVLLLVICAPLYAAPAGKVLYARGNVSAQAPGAGLRIIASGALVAVGDAVSTAEESFALIELIDHERITLRPDTTFAITAFDQTAGQESVALNLLKGGIRALTGLFGKRRPDSFRLTTPVATIGIRGTDFSARICGPECATDSATARVATPLTHIVARSLVSVGQVVALGSNGGERVLGKHSALFVGDVVKTAAHAYTVIAFRDQTRVTLQPESEFKIDEFVQAPATPERESTLFSLVRGGLRFATGLIGARRHDSVRIKTGVATIGIRGTGFDLLEGQECGGKQAAAGKPGITAQVWKGGIALQESHAEIVSGEAVCVLEKGQPVTKVAAKSDLGTPRPDEVEIPDDTFATEQMNGDEPGLHLSVTDGQVVLTNDAGSIDLGAGEDGFVGGANSSPLRADNQRSVGRGDPFFSLNPDSPLETLDKFQGDFGLTCPGGG